MKIGDKIGRLTITSLEQPLLWNGLYGNGFCRVICDCGYYCPGSYHSVNYLKYLLEENKDINCEECEDKKRQYDGK